MAQSVKCLSRVWGPEFVSPEHTHWWCEPGRSLSLILWLANWDYLVTFRANERPSLKQKVKDAWEIMTEVALWPLHAHVCTCLPVYTSAHSDTNVKACGCAHPPTPPPKLLHYFCPKGSVPAAAYVCTRPYVSVGVLVLGCFLLFD